jgi:hypothetical protein
MERLRELRKTWVRIFDHAAESGSEHIANFIATPVVSTVKTLAPIYSSVRADVLLLCEMRICLADVYAF